MVPGGKIIFDDYKWKLCPGVELAIKEFRDHDIDNNFIYEELFDENEVVDQHQCILTKTMNMIGL
jgi:hypothetical protein